MMTSRNVRKVIRSNFFLIATGLIWTLAVIGLTISTTMNRVIATYLVRFNEVNSSVISLNGTLFGFLLAALGILLAAPAESKLATLIRRNKRYKSDIIAYFGLAMTTSLIIAGTALGAEFVSGIARSALVGISLHLLLLNAILLPFLLLVFFVSLSD